MAKIEEFLTEEDEKEVVAAIQQAEKKTSGEIRVHIEKSSKGDIWNRAMEVFHLLKMDNTKQDNGVLIYVAIDDRNFVIYGDKGINNVVPDKFWETTKDEIVAEFKKGDFKQGIDQRDPEGRRRTAKTFSLGREHRRKSIIRQNIALMHLQKRNFLLLLFFTLTALTAFAQRDIPPKPSEQTSVYDYANVLSASEKRSLEQKLINYSDTTSTQIVIATINSLQGEYINTYATEWAHKWGIGQGKEDNGDFHSFSRRRPKGHDRDRLWYRG